MIGREKRVLLRHYLEQGMNKAAIARDLGISRRTVTAGSRRAGVETNGATCVGRLTNAARGSKRT